MTKRAAVGRAAGSRRAVDPGDPVKRQARQYGDLLRAREPVGVVVARLGRHLLRHLDCTGVSIICPDPDRAVSPLAFSGHADVSEQRMLASLFEMLPIAFKEFPLAMLQARARHGVAELPTSFERATLERSTLYNEFWRPLSLESQLVLPLAGGFAGSGFLCLARPKRGRPIPRIHQRYFALRRH